MPTIIQTINGKVTGLWGSALRRTRTGKLVPLQMGDEVQKGDVILTAQNGIVELTLPREAEMAAAAKAAAAPETELDRVIASLDGLGSAPACVFLETPTNPELQAHDFEALLRALRSHEQKTKQRVPVIVDTTLAPLFPLFDRAWARGWPFLLVKSGSKYFTRGKATLGVVACADEPLALRVVAHARALGRDADSFAKLAQLVHLHEALGDLRPRLQTISANTVKLAAGIRAALKRRGHEITLYAISEAQAAEGMASGLPLIIYEVYPGQEEGNLAYVQTREAGVYAPTPQEVGDVLVRWLDPNRSELREYAANSRRAGQPEAAERVARHVWRLANDEG